MATSTNSPCFSGLVSSLPIADRDILAGLGDDDILALWSAAKADDHRRLALTLLSIYNAVAPIHRLPFEVLSSIFEMCWKDRKSLRIGHVCRQWRSVLLDTSGFWASAVKREQFHQDDCATGYLGAVLERSAPQVIAPSFQHFSERVSPFLALHADRIASLTVSLGRCTELFHLWSCLNTGMRSLSTLKISSVNDDWWDVESRIADENLRLSPTSLPCLTRVTAPGRFLQYFAIPSLRHITLQNEHREHIYRHRVHHYGSFWDALTVCAANLETLSLLKVAPLAIFGDLGPWPLSLPALRKLFVEDNTDACALVLSHLVPSETAHIRVSITDGFGLCKAVPPDAPAIQTALSAADSVVILNDPKSNAIAISCASCETERELLDISLRVKEPRRGGLRITPADLARYFQHKPGGPLVLAVLGDLDSWDVPGIDLRAFGPSLTAIVACGESMSHHVLKELARTDGPLNDDGDNNNNNNNNDPGAGVPGVRARCPDLHTLTFAFKFDWESDLDHERWEDRDSDEDSEEPEPAGASASTQMGGPCGAAIDAYFRSVCAELERVLAQRRKMGARLSCLALECPDMRQSGSQLEGDSARPDSKPPLGGAEPSEPELEPWGRIVERLEKLVDGQVVFSYQEDS